VEHLENPAQAETFPHALGFGLLFLPFEVILCSFVLSTAGPQAFPPLPIPYWIIGAIIGAVASALGIWVIARASRDLQANSTPTTVDLDDGQFVAHLPPVEGARAAPARQVVVEWTDVERVVQSGFIRSGMVRFRRPGGRSVAVAGTPVPEGLYLAKGVAQKVDEAWRAWKDKNPSSRTAEPS
jgi:hypothetical protein